MRPQSNKTADIDITCKTIDFTNGKPNVWLKFKPYLHSGLNQAKCTQCDHSLLKSQEERFFLYVCVVCHRRTHVFIENKTPGLFWLNPRWFQLLEAAWAEKWRSHYSDRCPQCVQIGEKKCVAEVESVKCVCFCSCICTRRRNSLLSMQSAMCGFGIRKRPLSPSCSRLELGAGLKLRLEEWPGWEVGGVRMPRREEGIRAQRQEDDCPQAGLRGAMWSFSP